MNHCSTASYPNRKEALVARRHALRTYEVFMVATHCETCDKYHLKAESDRTPLPANQQAILTYLAQGYRDNEIGPLVKLRPRYVELLIGEMARRFYALSRPNLVAIVISLGIIDPNDFVPTSDSERRHA